MTSNPRPDHAPDPKLADRGEAASPEWAGEWGGTDIAFGEHGAKLTYGSYLALEQLLSAHAACCNRHSGGTGEAHERGDMGAHALTSPPG